MMAKKHSVNAYIQLLKANVSRCKCIESNDHFLPTNFNKNKTELVIQRKETYGSKIFKHNPKANSPITLVNGGRIELFLRLSLKDKGEEIDDINFYRLAFLGLPDNSNGIHSLRYDYDKKDHKDDWDDELGDNPEHPQAHVHINFTNDDRAANDLRMPTGQVCPILILRAFDHWYCETLATQGKKK